MPKIPFIKSSKYSPEVISLQTTNDKSDEHTNLTEVIIGENIPSSSNNIQSSKVFHNEGFIDNEHETKELLDTNKQECTPLQQKSRVNNANANLQKKQMSHRPLHNIEHAVFYLREQGADIRLKHVQGFTYSLIEKDLDVNATENKKCIPLQMENQSISKEETQLGDIGSVEKDGLKIINLEKNKINNIFEESVEELKKDVDNDNSVYGTDYTYLHCATINGDLKVAKYLLDKNYKIDAYDHEHMTPSHRACQFGREDVLELLINRGASIESNDYNYFTPLMWAVVEGHNSIVEKLIKKGANVNATDINIKNVLHLAIENNTLSIRLLQILGCESLVNEPDKNFKRPLHYAVMKNYFQSLANEPDENFKRPIHYAVMKNYFQFLVNEPDENFKRPLHYAVMKNDFQSLVNKPDKNFRRPLHYAVMKNDFQSVKLLIENSADITATDNEEKTALHTAAEYGNRECLLELVKNKPQNVNGTDNKGRSPLHLAAKKGCLETSTALVENGAEISIYDCKNFTPLIYAAKYGHDNIVLLLLQKGADVDRSDAKYITPIQHASINGHVKCIITLLYYGADMLLVNKDNKNCFDLAVENCQKEACLTLIKNGFKKISFSKYFEKRWIEALKETNQEQNPMEKLIAFVPDIAKIVLDECIQRSNDDKIENSEIYKFKYLDLEPEKSYRTKRKQYFGPSTMIKFERDDLLFHQLTLQFISDKWLRLGLCIHLISLCIYILFLCMVTSLIYVDKAREKYLQYDGLQRLTISAAIVFTVFEICKEVYQAYMLGKEYLKDLSNYLELLLYSSTLTYLASRYFDNISYNDSIKDVKWISATIAVLLAWINLLLYLNRYTFFGIYVTMIIEILKSLINVVLVLFFIILGFSLSFFMLLGNQNIFRVPGKSIMKTIAMTLGESNFEEIFVDNYIFTSTDNIFNAKLPYPETSLILFTLFLIVCAIVIINLLVGLAVGDIAEVRKSALKLMLKSQIDILQASESKCPLWLQNKIYRKSLTINPNMWIMRFLNWLVKLNHKSFKKNHERVLKKDLAKDLELQLIELDNRMHSVEFRMRKNIDLAKEVGDYSKI